MLMFSTTRMYGQKRNIEIINSLYKLIIEIDLGFQLNNIATYIIHMKKNELKSPHDPDEMKRKER